MNLHFCVVKSGMKEMDWLGGELALQRAPPQREANGER